VDDRRRGIIHSEMPQQTAPHARLQLWINLPAKDKMKPASYATRGGLTFLR